MTRKDAFIYLSKFAGFFAAIIVYLVVFNIAVGILVGLLIEIFPGMILTIIAGLLAFITAYQTGRFVYKLVRALFGVEPEEVVKKRTRSSTQRSRIQRPPPQPHGAHYRLH